MSLFFSNPELIRNARIQLRPGRMIAAMVISAAMSVTTWASIRHTDVTVTIDGLSGLGAVFALILAVQVAVLLIGGGIYCLQSVHREKELNTFDYQRVTQLTSIELAIGKLLGAPIAAYFVVLCLMPVALLSAVRAHIGASTVIEAYVVLVLGSIAFHALALLVSMLLRRGGSAVAIFLYLAIVGVTYFQGMYVAWTIRSISPFFALDLAKQDSPYMTFLFKDATPRHFLTDSIFGKAVPHFTVLIGLYLIFTAWFLLAVKRNLKRDPSFYEIYSPKQALTFVMYLSLLMLSFPVDHNFP